VTRSAICDGVASWRVTRLTSIVIYVTSALLFTGLVDLRESCYTIEAFGREVRVRPMPVYVFNKIPK
jgi:hypothetical protein